RKNRGLLRKPAFWRMLLRLLAARLRPSAAAAEAPVLFVATHHKVMTTYFTAVLRLLGFGLKRRYERVYTKQPSAGAGLVLSMHGKLDLARLRPYRGVHVMRDPRDMIVSGYHYHKWTHENWVHRPDDQGLSYQQKLNRADKRDGLFMEIDHFIFFYRETLERWNIDDPDILEVAYDDLMGEDRESLYARLFRHLGLEGRDLGLAVDLMRLFEAGSRTGRKSGAVAQKNHLRSGRSGQWHAELEDDHIAYIEQELGHVLRKFGY
ncbi:MAG TPA: sulfotransferase domain-containing protein, partial [Paracoccaceae bacterium]